MGRLFQYNRLKNGDTTIEDISQNSIHKRNEKHDRSSTCSACSDLYGVYDIFADEKNETHSGDGMWINRLLCTDIFPFQVPTCPTYSCSSSQRHNSESELLMGAVKRTKVFNCMRQLFKRNIVQQQNDLDKKNWKKLNATSDYDYDEDDDPGCLKLKKTIHHGSSKYRKLAKVYNTKDSPLRLAFSFRCCQPTQQEDTNSSNCATGSDAKERRVENGDVPESASISNRCQQTVKTSKKSSTYASRKSSKRMQRIKERYFRVTNANNRSETDDDDDYDDNSNGCSDLLKTSWYQPRITTKAVYERLRQSMPGSFLVRRKSRTFELCLRSETKIQHFTVIGSNDMFKLKGAKKQFPSLKALVTHHSVMAEQLPLTLLLPHERQFGNHMSNCTRRYNNDFDTFESLQILGI